MRRSRSWRRRRCGRSTRSSTASFGNRSPPARYDAVTARGGASTVQAVLAIPKIVTGGLVLLAIGVMLYGVFMRYVMLPITDWLDVDPVNFFWVEEVGETALA